MLKRFLSYLLRLSDAVLLTLSADEWTDDEPVEEKHEPAIGGMSLQALGITQFSAKHIGKSFELWQTVEGRFKITAKLRIDFDGTISHFRAILPNGQEALFPVYVDGMTPAPGSIWLAKREVKRGEVIDVQINQI